MPVEGGARLVAPDRIESPRLIVRLATAADLPALLEVNGDAEVTALLPYPTWRSLDDGVAWFERMSGLQEAGSALQFAVVLKASGKAIGSCLVFRFEAPSARAELGYVLGRAHWGQGLMGEALAALLRSAFATMGLRRIEAEVSPRNPRSAALLMRLGFSREGLLRKRWITKGQAEDVEMYGLLDGELRTAAAVPGR